MCDDHPHEPELTKSQRRLKEVDAHNAAWEFAKNMAHVPEENKKEILKKKDLEIEKEPTLEDIEKRVAALKYDRGFWVADEYAGIIWAGPHGIFDGRICDIRGWGHLTGGGGLHLDGDLAAEVQDARKDFIAHSRKDIPWLIKSNRAKDLEIEKLKSQLSEYENQKNERSSHSRREI